MGRKMRRGKQQVLFNYLPGKTFDFERVATIAQVRSIRGVIRTDLNNRVLLRRIRDEASAWAPDFRPSLRDEVLQNPNRFVFLEPRDVQAEIFPKIFWCQNRSCGRLSDYSQLDSLPRETCQVCRSGRLVQLRWVQIHRCGALQRLSPYCPTCRSSNEMALNTRGSERIADFQWICNNCQRTYSTSALFRRPCRQCAWTDQNLRFIDIEVHRAGRTYYPHRATLLNIPTRQLDPLLNIPEWPAIAAAKFLRLPGMVNQSLSDFTPSPGGANETQPFTLSTAEEQNLRDNGFSDAQIEDFRVMQEKLRSTRTEAQQDSLPSNIARMLEQRTGVRRKIWENAGQEMLEAIMPLELGTTEELLPKDGTVVPVERRPVVTAANRAGLSQLTLVMDFPITSATYGFSRAEYQPNLCRLNPFPPDPDHGGLFPIFVDLVQADALLLRLDPQRVCAWLESNGVPLTIPSGSDPDLSRQAYFVQLFEDASLYQTLSANEPQARLVFGLLHTFSHFCVRQAALFCGLDRTSLSEYLLPRALTFAIYCNHRFGATIGALTALFEQSLAEWLNTVRNTRRCVYDPVCSDREGSCHACTQLAETSCRFFNLNLGRAFLFGGRDPYFGQIQVGYFDPSLS